MTEFMTYPKIPTPFPWHTEGPLKHTMDFLRRSSPEIEVLYNVENWTWTEKLDGVNVRILWDGHRPHFAGRTDKTELQPDVMAWLKENIREEVLEQVFQDKSAVLFGEAVGPKVQAGAAYGDTRVILFDVFALGADKPMWLSRQDAGTVAVDLGLRAVPVLSYESPASMVAHYRTGALLDSVVAPLSTKTYMLAEGVVGTAPGGLLNRFGNPVKVKVKAKDFRK